MKVSVNRHINKDFEAAIVKHPTEPSIIQLNSRMSTAAATVECVTNDRSLNWEN